VENLRVREAAPTSVNVTVGKRSREYLTDREVERLVEAAKQNRSGHRDATAILVAYRHGNVLASHASDGALHRDRAQAQTHLLHRRRFRLRLRTDGRAKPNVAIRLHLGAWRNRCP
jgi:hypothetical protein